MQHSPDVFRSRIFDLTDDAHPGIVDQQFDLNSQPTDFFVQQSSGFRFGQIDGHDMAAGAVSSIEIRGQFGHAILAAGREDQVHTATGELHSKFCPIPDDAPVIAQRSLKLSSTWKSRPANQCQ